MTKFGIIGIENIDGRIVQILSRAGHQVVVWDPKIKVYDELTAHGAVIANDLVNLVMNSDVVLSYIENVFQMGYILRTGAIAGKGFINMSEVDCFTSRTLSHQIISQSGRYLEVHLRLMHCAYEERIVLLAAGDKALYDESIVYFETITLKMLYCGALDNDGQMFVALQLVDFFNYPSRAECVALAECAGIPLEEVQQLLSILRPIAFAAFGHS